MTLLLREVAAVVAGTAVWLAVVALVAATLPLSVALLRRRRPGSRDLLWALAGALVAAGASVRLGVDDPLEVAIARRPLPLLWAGLGSAVATTLVAWRRRSRLSDRAAG